MVSLTEVLHSRSGENSKTNVLYNLLVLEAVESAAGSPKSKQRTWSYI